MSASDDKDRRSSSVGHANTVASSPGVGTSTSDTQPGVDPFVGQIVAERYHVLSLLGRGGMGAVYVCEHVQLKKRMALKVLAEDLRSRPELVQRFLKEARAAAQIGHPNIVDVYDLGELPGGGAYIAMALLEGQDLETDLAGLGVMPVERARKIVGQICRALAAAHSKGIVHRDMKPANVFLARDPDGNEQVKVLDFGIAQVTEAGDSDAARLTQTGAIVGTPAFMSPEQGRGDRADHRTDIYSVGCILYNLLTGQFPFEANSAMGMITKHLFEPPVPPSQRVPERGLTPAIDEVVVRALAKKPEDRFQTMKEMWTALEAGVSDEPMEWPDSTSGRYARLTPAPSPRTEGGEVVQEEVPRSSARRIIPVAIGVCALGGLAAWWALRPGPAPVAAPAPVVAAPAPVVVVPPAPEVVTVEVRTEPPGASIYEGERLLGTSPLKVQRAHGATATMLRASAPGRADATLSVDFDRDREVLLQLAPGPVSRVPIAHPSPTRRPEVGHVKKAGKTGELKDPFSQ